MFEDRRCSLQRQGTLHLGVKTVIVVIRVPEIRSRDRALQFVANTGPAKIYFEWATHDMCISKYSADEYYKAVDGPKEEHWYFTNHEFNDSAGGEVGDGLMGLWSEGRQTGNGLGGDQ